jgi:hypothetical protein
MLDDVSISHFNYFLTSMMLQIVSVVFFVLVLHDAYQERYLAHLSELPSFRLVLVVNVGSDEPLSSSTSHGSSHTWLALAHLRQ